MILLFLLSTGEQVGCGGELTSTSNIIASVDEDLNGLYDSSLNCLWIVRLNIDQVITFEFRDVDIHMKSSSCKGDYIEVCVMTKKKSRYITKPCPCIPLIPQTRVYMGFHILFYF